MFLYVCVDTAAVPQPQETESGRTSDNRKSERKEEDQINSKQVI